MGNTASLVVLISAGLAVITLSAFRFRKMESYEKKLAIFGVLWFIIFIIPACAQFGQWYAFTASMGIIITAMSFIRINLKKVYFRYLFYFVISLGLISAVVLSVRSNKWLYSGETALNAYHSIHYEQKGRDTLIFLGVPDKIDMVNTMKIGFTQAIWHYLDNDRIDVSSQLRLEMDRESFVFYERLTEDSIKMEVHYGRFIPQGSRSRAVLIDEGFQYDGGYQSFRIETKVKPNIVSTAYIKIKEQNLIDKTHIFNGKTFIPLKSLKVEEKSKKIYF